MDIPKYIGLFLLKNKYVYLHGLGNLELKRKPAIYDGEKLQPQPFDVTLTLGGSIDDSLANFIATNEQVSISKAANELRDFSIRSRTELQEGKEVIVPSIGKFCMLNGKIQFVTNEHFSFTPPGIPVIKTNIEQEVISPTYTVATNRKTSNISWSRAIGVPLALLGIIALCIFVYHYLNNRHKGADNENLRQLPVATRQDTVAKPPVILPPPADHTQPATTVTNTYKQDANNYDLFIGKYASRDKATQRLKQLEGYGYNNLEVVPTDSTKFTLLLHVSGPIADSSRVADSIGRKLNPGKVHVFH